VFKDLPQHNCEHNSGQGYKSEIDSKMKEIANGVKRRKKKHKVASGYLVRKLNEARTDFRAELRRRGIRKGGTDKNWRNATPGSTDWFDPFSMANDGNMDPIPFPLAGTPGEVADKIIAFIASL
jgi:hypothetical protein